MFRESRQLMSEDSSVNLMSTQGPEARNCLHAIIRNLFFFPQRPDWLLGLPGYCLPGIGASSLVAKAAATSQRLLNVNYN
jgi:hypothetical protein